MAEQKIKAIKYNARCFFEWTRGWTQDFNECFIPSHGIAFNTVGMKLTVIKCDGIRTQDVFELRPKIQTDGIKLDRVDRDRNELYKSLNKKLKIEQIQTEIEIPTIIADKMRDDEDSITLKEVKILDELLNQKTI